MQDATGGKEMSTKWKRGLIATGAMAAIGLGAAGIAQAVSGEEESLTGTNADRAAQAALDEAGGGEVLEVEAADDGASGYEVEVDTGDETLEVNVTPDFTVAGTETEGEDENDAGEDD
jgi:hypothetical protein